MNEEILTVYFTGMDTLDNVCMARGCQFSSVLHRDGNTVEEHSIQCRDGNVFMEESAG